MPKATASHKKKTPKKALGLGIDALIPDISVKDTTDGAFIELEIDRIVPNRYQPRKNFDDKELLELAESVKSQGILQPLLVREADMDYELVTGERRLRAARQAGLATVPVLVRDLSDAETLEISIVENIQRENLNPIEEAEAYHRLITEFGLTQEAVAERVGKSRSAVANLLRLRQLPKAIMKNIRGGDLSMGHARALLSLPTVKQQMMACRRMIQKQLSVRQTEALVKRLLRQPKSPKKAPDELDTYLQSLSEELSLHFGTRVRIVRRGKKGSVQIDFFSAKDLDRLIRLLKENG